MTGTFQRVKSSLMEILIDEDHKVIALTGKWGTGKTYLWKIVQAELLEKPNFSKKPIYASLFGVKTINDLKLRVLENTCLTDSSAVNKIVKVGGGVFSQVVKKITGYSTEDTAILWLPNIVAERLIVIDDVERKHKSLDIDEFLGFLNEYSETHNNRFLILLNTEKLVDDEGMWATLREKVIDVEIVLDPPPEECFDIAAQGNALSCLPAVREAVSILGVNNIRVIRRILKTIDYVLAMVDVEGVPATRWVPSTVLLTAFHFRAVENVPSFEYLRSFSPYRRYLKEKEGEVDENEQKWDKLLDKLGIVGSDVHSEVLQDYLQCGLLDVDRLRSRFDEYKFESRDETASSKRNDFFKAFWWNPHLTDAALIAMAKEFLPTANILDVGAITDVVSIVKELGDHELARQFLDDWLLSVETRPAFQQLEERLFETSHRTYHPEVVAKLNAMRDQQHPPLTVVQVAEQISIHRSWGEREKIALRSSTVELYVEALKSVKNDLLRIFVVSHLEWVRDGGYDENFNVGAKNFVLACKVLYVKAPESRLSKLIEREFRSYGVFDRLSS